MGTGGGRGRCGTDCHCVSEGCGMERAAHCCSTCRLCAGVSVAGLSCRPMALSCAARESRLLSAASRLSSPLLASNEGCVAGCAADATAAGPTGRFCMLAATTAATVGAPGLMPFCCCEGAGPPSEGNAAAGRKQGQQTCLAKVHGGRAGLRSPCGQRRCEPCARTARWHCIQAKSNLWYFM